MLGADTMTATTEILLPRLINSSAPRGFSLVLVAEHFDLSIVRVT